MIKHNNFKIKLSYIILLIILLIYLFMFWYIPNTNSAKNLIADYDFNYYEVLFKKKLPSYNHLVLNNNFLDLIKLRDKYNQNWSNENVSNASIGNSWGKIFLFSNTCIIRSKLRTTISFEINPVTGNFVYNRLTLLKKHEGKWYIKNDIISKQELSILELFNNDRIIDEIKKYNNITSN